MTTTSELSYILGEILQRNGIPVSPTSIRKAVSQLRKKGIIPKQGHGTSAFKVKPQHISYVIIVIMALMISSTNDAERAFLRIFFLKNLKLNFNTNKVISYFHQSLDAKLLD